MADLRRDAVRDDARKETDRQVAMFVYMAKSDALKFMGDDDGALALAEKLLELDRR